MHRVILELNGVELDLLEKISWHEDEGPYTEGWQSQSMEGLRNKIKSAIESSSEYVPAKSVENDV